MSDVTSPAAPPSQQRPRAGFAVLVAAGILLSRIAGLFGEGVLSASFIPVYARLLAEDDEETAGKLAGVIFALLFLIVGGIVLVCVLITPWIIDLIAPGFTGDVRLLTIRIVQILFPAT